MVNRQRLTSLTRLAPTSEVTALRFFSGALVRALLAGAEHAHTYGYINAKEPYMVIALLPFVVFVALVVYFPFSEKAE